MERRGSRYFAEQTHTVQCVCVCGSRKPIPFSRKVAQKGKGPGKEEHMPFALLHICSATAPAETIENHSFEQFVADYKRSYAPNSTEFALRRRIFDENLRRVRAHNADASQTWKRGINRFSDQTPEEAKSFFGYNRFADDADSFSSARKSREREQAMVPGGLPEGWPMPSAVDWTALWGSPLHTWSGAPSIMTGMKEQGACGSCWALAVAANLESYAALATGSLPVLSAQQLLSCTPNPRKCGGDGGCDGSTPMLAYEYVHNNGIITDESWEYTGKDCEGTSLPDCNRCNNIGSEAKVHTNGWVQVKENDYDAVIHALATQGPLVVGVAASSWFDYQGGVFDGCANASRLVINHAVQLVGYGTDPELGDFWRLRNWWGEEWGEGGYMRLRRTSAKHCANDPDPHEGFGCEDGPASVTVCGDCGILFKASHPVEVSVSQPGQPR